MKPSYYRILRHFLVIAFVVLFSDYSFAQNAINVLQRYMTEVRNGSHAPVPPLLIDNPRNESTILQALAFYQKDSVVIIRSRAYNIATRLGQQSNSPKTRQVINAQLVSGVGDRDDVIVGNNIGGLMGFRADDFSERTKELLIACITPNTSHLGSLIQVAGFLQLHGAKPKLDELLLAKISLQVRWSIRLALARMSDATSENLILEKLSQAIVNDDFVYDIVPDLIYTRRKSVYQYLENVMMSDVPNCSSVDPDSNANILCGYRVMESVAPTIVDFPILVDEYGELEVDDYEKALLDVRAWFQQNPDYQLKMESY